jgi:DNA-binding NtrC family response regulator
LPAKRSTILLVDDDPDQVALLTAILERERVYRTLSATASHQGLELARREAPDLAICDVSMPEMDGIELTRILREEFPDMPVIILTGMEGATTAEEAFAAGAIDFVTKPVEPRILITRIHRALDDAPAREILREATRDRFDATILGDHPRIKELRDFIGNVASAARVPSLLLGESGTGKNLVARAIHAASEAAPFRFVEVNCAALPANLLEAELFGYEKGAFTDARQAKQGLAEVAASGTLFLDEIGTLPLELQAKLLTFLESRTFRRVGGTVDRRSDARIVAATNADVHEEVHAGRFREDLYYRLAVAQFVLPPLREVRSDIPMFAEHFVEKAAAYFRRPAPTLDPHSSRRLQEYDWPGNVRELRNAIERALIFSRGPVLTVDMPRGRPGAAEAPGAAASGGLALPLGLPLEEVERRYIEATLEACDGQVARAAEELGVTRKVLWMRRKRLGILE